MSSRSAGASASASGTSGEASATTSSSKRWPSIQARRSRTTQSITTTSSMNTSQTAQWPAVSTTARAPCGCVRCSASSGRTATAAMSTGGRSRRSQRAPRGIVGRKIGHRSGPTVCTGSVRAHVRAPRHGPHERAAARRRDGRPHVDPRDRRRRADHRLDNYGIHPRDVDGLAEILAAPFLHAGFGHLISNTVPFLAMGAAIALGGLVRVALVTLIVAVVSGFGTWLIAGVELDPPRRQRRRVRLRHVPRVAGDLLQAPVGAGDRGGRRGDLGDRAAAGAAAAGADLLAGASVRGDRRGGGGVGAGAAAGG